MNQFNTDQEAKTMMQLAFGRIMRMGTRETQPRDAEEYENCRWIIFNASEYLGMAAAIDNRPNYARDYYK